MTSPADLPAIARELAGARDYALAQRRRVQAWTHLHGGLVALALVGVLALTIRISGFDVNDLFETPAGRVALFWGLSAAAGTALLSLLGMALASRRLNLPVRAKQYVIFLILTIVMGVQLLLQAQPPAAGDPAEMSGGAKLLSFVLALYFVAVVVFALTDALTLRATRTVYRGQLPDLLDPKAFRGIIGRGRFVALAAIAVTLIVLGLVLMITLERSSVFGTVLLYALAQGELMNGLQNGDRVAARTAFALMALSPTIALLTPAALLAVGYAFTFWGATALVLGATRLRGFPREAEP